MHLFPISSTVVTDLIVTEVVLLLLRTSSKTWRYKKLITSIESRYPTFKMYLLYLIRSITALIVMEGLILMMNQPHEIHLMDYLEFNHKAGIVATLLEVLSLAADSDVRLSDSSSLSSGGSIISSWQKGQLLGRGSFGSVYGGISGDGEVLAVKEVSLLDQGSQAQECIQQLENEIALLSQLQHQNIVRYRGTAKDESNLYIFLELVTQGSLLKLYQKNQLRNSVVSMYTRQILDGLRYLHAKNVIHRDIKCANILVDANGAVKLADFGLAKVSKFNDIKSCKGTPFWMAPEVINPKRNDGYGSPADIWSLGCTVLEMLTGQIPYGNREPVQALFRIGRGTLPDIPDTLSLDARHFVLECLKVNPEERPTAAELLNHPFVRKPLPSLGSGEQT